MNNPEVDEIVESTWLSINGDEGESSKTKSDYRRKVRINRSSASLPSTSKASMRKVTSGTNHVEAGKVEKVRKRKKTSSPKKGSKTGSKRRGRPKKKNLVSISSEVVKISSEVVPYDEQEVQIKIEPTEQEEQYDYNIAPTDIVQNKINFLNDTVRAFMDTLGEEKIPWSPKMHEIYQTIISAGIELNTAYAVEQDSYRSDRVMANFLTHTAERKYEQLRKEFDREANNANICRLELHEYRAKYGRLPFSPQ